MATAVQDAMGAAGGLARTPSERMLTEIEARVRGRSVEDLRLDLREAYGARVAAVAEEERVGGLVEAAHRATVDADAEYDVARRAYVAGSLAGA